MKACTEDHIGAFAIYIVFLLVKCNFLIIKAFCIKLC